MSVNVSIPEAVVMPLRKIRPYQNNPRRIPPEAVAAVKESIERYGYHQPIVVDTEGVIVVGHTRYAALVELGVTEAQVYVTDLPEDKVREYRLVDNKTAEMGQWDHGALIIELREFEQALLEQFFPDVDLEVTALSEALVTNSDVEKATKKVLAVREAPLVLTTTVVCPACFHSFEVRTDSLPGLSRTDMEVLAAAADDGRAE